MNVIDMYFYRGINSYHIAERLGVSHQRVSQTLVASLGKIRNKLDKLRELASIFGIHSDPVDGVGICFNNSGGSSESV